MSENKPLIEFTTDNKVIINGIEITNKNEWNRVLNHLEDYYKNFNKISTLLNYEQDKRIELESIIKEVREYIEEMQIWLVDFEDFGITTKGLLEILDKGSDEISK